MDILAGTSGWSYKEWKNVFYPEDLPAAKMLGYFSSQLPTVELNNTFYRLPKQGQLATWAAETPPAFRFAVKASQKITHIRRLKEAESETEYLLKAAAELGDRLGSILFQTPPNMKLDLDRLHRFLDFLPGGTKAAFEFRHPSWREDGVLDALRAHDCAWCVADVEGEDAEMIATATWGYLRLRRVEYSPADVERWAARVKSQPWVSAGVYFKHEDAGTGPRLARQFLDAL